MKLLSSADVRRLRHNKYVAVLGDSIQRSVNKDYVKILQNDEFRTEKQLKGKGEMSFANDMLGELWDVIRYHEQSLQMYKTNLNHLFNRLTKVLSPKCLVICNMSMSVGFKAGEVLEYPIPNVCWDIIEGNFYSATLADLYQLDVPGAFVQSWGSLDMSTQSRKTTRIFPPLTLKEFEFDVRSLE
uniref:Uncharacterized protein n=1 Tax=Pyxicephalus adspersus TaxID=30357 RepID=A0AAV3AHN7_PYXAD|nr:TPA: hypothetical protein GDO54_018138 [Pyxicephalus adspersus]